MLPCAFRALQNAYFPLVSTIQYCTSSSEKYPVVLAEYINLRLTF